MRRYFGEHLTPKLLGQTKKALAVTGTLFGLSVAGFAISTYLQTTHISTLKQDIDAKTVAIFEARKAKEAEKNAPNSNVPKGLAAIGVFQNRLTKLAGEKNCTIAQFQASDQTNPYISTFSTGAQANGNWVQVEVKMNLQGSTQAVVSTLRDMGSLDIPFEFSSVEMSRSDVSPTGDAKVAANVAIRVLTIAGGN